MPSSLQVERTPFCSTFRDHCQQTRQPAQTLSTVPAYHRVLDLDGGNGMYGVCFPDRLRRAFRQSDVSEFAFLDKCLQGADDLLNRYVGIDACHLFVTASVAVRSTDARLDGRTWKRSIVLLPPSRLLMLSTLLRRFSSDPSGPHILPSVRGSPPFTDRTREHRSAQSGEPRVETPYRIFRALPILGACQRTAPKSRGQRMYPWAPCRKTPLMWKCRSAARACHQEWRD